MKKFRFAIMGAGSISNRFADAVGRLDGCEVSAIASRDYNRAEAFAKRYGIKNAYGDYRKMLVSEKPDCVYIGTVTGTHYELTMLCLEYGVPVICEKAMFMTAKEANEAFRKAKERGVFVMEAMWSRFLPAILKVKSWIDEGRIGAVSAIDFVIGFSASRDPEKRYYSKALGGGVSFDLTVYGYEIVDLLLGSEMSSISADAVFGETGVDLVNSVTITYDRAAASILTTFMSDTEDKMIVYGDRGKIVVPNPHVTNEAYLYEHGKPEEHFRDTVTENGFTYEAEAAARSIMAGKLECDVVPWSLTLGCAEMFDMIYEKRK